MSQTVIGFFDDQSDVQKAVQQLQSRGISRDRIDISRGGGGATGNHSGASGGSRHAGDTDVNPVSGSERDENSVRKTSDGSTVDPDGRNTNVFTDFFNNLFGKSDDKDKDNDDAGRYSHVASRSHAVVTVHTQSREEAERAADILDECGAVDVNERAGQSGYSGTSGNASNMPDNDYRSNESLNTGSLNTESENLRMRSRVFDRRLDDNQRLRNWDLND